MVFVNRGSGGKTCFACPAVWEYRADDNQVVYIRFRHGWFTASTGETLDDAAGSDQALLIDIELDDPSGYMHQEDMEKLVAGKVEFYGEPNDKWTGTL